MLRTAFQRTQARWQRLPLLARSVAYYGFVTASWVPVYIFFLDYVVDTVRIEGPSMYPTFNTKRNQTTRGDLAVNWKWKGPGSVGEVLRKGMIVTFWSPVDPNQLIVKRITGLEGDVVRTRPPYPSPTMRVPTGHVWVEGDGEPRDSRDSNHYGPISAALIVGRITHVLSPWNRVGRVKWWEWEDKRRWRTEESG